MWYALSPKLLFAYITLGFVVVEVVVVEVDVVDVMVVEVEVVEIVVVCGVEGVEVSISVAENVRKVSTGAVFSELVDSGSAEITFGTVGCATNVEKCSNCFVSTIPIVGTDFSPVLLATKNY